MWSMRIATILSVAACLAFAGCGGDDDEDAASNSPPPTVPAATTPPTDAAVAIDMKDIKYVPAKASAKVGQTVRWTNSDPVAHTVTATSGSDIDSGTINANDTYEAKFTRAGTVAYFCEIHPNQKGTVTVR